MEKLLPKGKILESEARSLQGVSICANQLLKESATAQDQNLSVGAESAKGVEKEQPGA
jgi:hypothetical protein